MASPELEISDWKLIRLTMEDIGPFRQGPQVFEFFGVDTENGTATGAGPANIYMVLAKNGRGKTTAMETIYGLFGMLNSEPTGRFVDGRETGRAQIDVRGKWTREGQTTTVLLSLWTGSEGPVVDWTEEELDEVAQVREWATLGLSWTGSGVERTSDTNQLGRYFFDAVQAQADQPPTLLFGESQTLPTVLYFPAHRRVVAPNETGSVSRPNGWGYQPAQYFDSDGPDWGSSVDNLLVWLEWLGDERIAELLTFLNGMLFQGELDKQLTRPHRETLRTFVQTRHGFHELSALSHGERALLQLMTRQLAHMTANTIVLIDEMEVHLHSRWMNRLYEAQKELLRKYPAFTLVFTTHNRELLTNFRHNVKEPGLVKGGYLIEDGNL